MGNEIRMKWEPAQYFLDWYCARYGIQPETFLELLLIDLMSRSEVQEYFEDEMIEPVPFVYFDEIRESGLDSDPKQFLSTGRRLYESLVMFYVSQVGEPEEITEDKPVNETSDIPGWNEYRRRKQAAIDAERGRQAGMDERTELRAWAVEQGYLTAEQARGIGPAFAEAIKQFQSGETDEALFKRRIAGFLERNGGQK